MMSESKDPVEIVVVPAGDLTIRLYEALPDGEKFIGASGQMLCGRVLATMKVSRNVLADNSMQFKAMLFGNFGESTQKVIDVHEGTVASLELWFRVLHGNMSDAMYEIKIEDVWEAIEVCGYRDYDIVMLQDWFAKWLARKDLKKLKLIEMRQLLYPCREFDHAEGFAFLTRKLAYEMAGHVTEINPTNHRHLHLDGNVIGFINGARGSLRSKLLRGLFEPVGRFLKQSCSCKEKTLFAYCMGLSKTGIWPLEHHHKKSVNEVLESHGFKNFQCKIPEGACPNCSSKCRPNAIETTRCEIANEFHGLCLDCMDRSKPKTGNIDEDYWQHDINQAWGSRCRVKHGQPTWYFSFMGRKTDMAAHQSKKKMHWIRNREFGDDNHPLSVLFRAEYSRIEGYDRS